MLVLTPASFRDLGEYFAVLLRLTSKRIRYLLVFMPGKPGCDLELLGCLYAGSSPAQIGDGTPETWVSPLFALSKLRPG